MSDQFTARTETEETVTKRLEDQIDLNLINKVFTRQQILQLDTSITNVLGGTHSRAQSGLADVPNLKGLMLKTPNKLNSAKEDGVVTTSQLLKANEELIKQKTAEHAKDNSVLIPNKLTKEMADVYSEEHNCSNQSSLGGRDAVIKFLKKLFGMETLGPFLKEPNGIDLKSHDKFMLHELFAFLLDAADRALFADQLTELINTIKFEVNFQQKMSVNAANFMNKLQFLKDNGIVVDTSIMFAVFMAAIEGVLTEKWAYHFNQVFDEIKQKYPPSHKWTIDDFNKVVDKLGTADAKRDLQAAPAPGDLEETANAVTMDTDVSSIALSVLNAITSHDDYSTASEEGEASAVQDKSSSRSRSSTRSSSEKSGRSKSGVRISEEQKEKNMKCPHCKKFKRTKKHPYKSPDQCYYNPEFKGTRPDWAEETLKRALLEEFKNKSSE